MGKKKKQFYFFYCIYSTFIFKFDSFQQEQMTSAQAVTKIPFQFEIDTTTCSGQTYYGFLIKKADQFICENLHDDSIDYCKNLTVTVGSGRFGCLLEFCGEQSKFCGEEALEFGADINKFLDIDKIVADIELERIAIEEQRDEANASQRIENKIKVPFCENLIKFQPQFTVELVDCHMYRKDCVSDLARKRQRVGSSVKENRVDSWRCSWKITPK